MICKKKKRTVEEIPKALQHSGAKQITPITVRDTKLSLSRQKINRNIVDRLANRVTAIKR